MKVVYRILISLLIIAVVFGLLRWQGLPTSENLLLEYPNPIRESVAEYVGGYAREHLTELQQILYDAAYGVIEEGGDSVSLPIRNFSDYDMEKVLFSILNDRPDFFWVNVSDSSYITDNNGIILTLNLTASGEQLKTMRSNFDAEVKRITAFMNEQQLPNEYEKAVFLHDYIASNCSYDKSQQLPNIHNASGVLISKSGVCDGYAYAYSVLLREIGIESYYVPGTVNGPDGVQGHAWVVANLDGIYSHIDPTWDDIDNEMFEGYDVGSDVVSHTYFGLSDDEIGRTHTVEPRINYPLPVATTNGWFSYFGLAGERTDSVADNASKMLISNIEKSTPYVEVKLSDRDAFYDLPENYEEGVGRLIERGNEMLEEEGIEERLSERSAFLVTSAEDGCVLLLFEIASETSELDD